jgi:hypothetical protein
MPVKDNDTVFVFYHLQKMNSSVPHTELDEPDFDDEEDDDDIDESDTDLEERWRTE